MKTVALITIMMLFMRNFSEAAVGSLNLKEYLDKTARVNEKFVKNIISHFHFS